jgi:integrase
MAKIAKRRGKWVVDWYDPVTKKRSREVCADRDAAKRRLGEVLKSGERIGLKSTLKEYAEKWLEHMKNELVESTHQEYSAVLKNHIYPVFGDKAFSKITRAMIRDFIAAKRKEGYNRSTVRNMLAPIRGMYNQAADDGEPIDNPAARMGKQNKRTEPKPDINPYSPEEVPLMLAKALQLVPLYYALLLTAVRTGIRQGELIALRAFDVDFKNRFIHVQRSLSRGKLKLPKNGKAPFVDMSKQTAAVLQELKREPEDWLFQNSAGTQIDASNLRKMWEKFQKDAELRRIRFHDLRHTFASLHIQNGESLPYIRDQMGHSSIKVTVDFYRHLIPGGNREAADRLDDKEPS